MPVGGFRPGAGRKKGSSPRDILAVQTRLKELDCDPIEGLVRIARESEVSGNKELAARCYRDLTSYVHPKLRSMEISGQFDVQESLSKEEQAKEDQAMDGMMVQLLGSDPKLIALSMKSQPNLLQQAQLEYDSFAKPQDVEVEPPKHTNDPKKEYLYGEQRPPVIIDVPIEIEIPPPKHPQKVHTNVEGPTVITASGQVFDRADLEEL